LIYLVKYESQKVVELKYKDHYVGEGYPDIIVHFGKNKIVLELKAVGGGEYRPPSEEQQIKGYMRVLRIRHGLLINFQQPQRKGKSQLEIKEITL